MPSTPKLRDVAKLAEVSEMTASRALRRVGDVSAATRKKVEEAALALGYVPNKLAGNLASRTSNLVGVIVPSLSSFVFPEVLNGISVRLEGSGMQPVTGVTDYDLEKEEAVIRQMLSWRPRGLIIAGLEHTDGARKILKASNVPIVEIMDVDGQPIQHCVGISHVQAGRDMARKLVASGYRKIAFIGTKMPKDFRAQKRLDGFMAGLSEAGLPLCAQQLYTGGSSIENGRALTARLLAEHPEVDCIYYSSDVMSVGGLMHCLAQGISVPGDLALAGFNNLEILKGLPRKLATTDAHRYAIGERAAELILAHPDTIGEDTARTIALSAEVAAGDTI
jgi:LacI family gluconate utilization system Gnt-I transcriptional repressor